MRSRKMQVGGQKLGSDFIGELSWGVDPRLTLEGFFCC